MRKDAGILCGVFRKLRMVHRRTHQLALVSGTQLRRMLLHPCFGTTAKLRVRSSVAVSCLAGLIGSAVQRGCAFLPSFLVLSFVLPLLKYEGRTSSLIECH